jgi:hypothetical protein
VAIGKRFAWILRALCLQPRNFTGEIGSVTERQGFEPSVPRPEAQLCRKGVERVRYFPFQEGPTVGIPFPPPARLSHP